MGCGVACVASVIGESFATALTRFEDKERAQTTGYPRKELLRIVRAALSPLEFRLRPLRGGSQRTGWRERWASIEDRAIVCVSQFDGDPWLHYVVHDQGRDRWMDPWVNLRLKNKKADANRARAGWRTTAELPRTWRPLSVIAASPRR
ncbi:MAG: hypothetical protein R3B06_12475 [Kofleriaceae bacterium]